jgi:hypothetical protein
MNLTYKVNYFKKKTDETASGPASPVFAMLKKVQAQQGPQGPPAGPNYSMNNSNLESSNTGTG